ncbi:MAG: hypothetical protein KJ792_09805 [Actinobacteria bacterium]|nr:hypothetical protein [Actinomycetota bacterium]
MSGSTVAAIGALVDSHRELTPLLDAHLADNDGEFLPHLVLAEIVRWLVAHLGTLPETCRSILNWLEWEYVRGPEDVRELIAVSGVEMIPDPGQWGAELRNLLGPELRKLDPWLT